jgi:hypothetical protein
MDPTVTAQSLTGLIPFQACEFSKRKTEQPLCATLLSDLLTPRFIPTGSDQRHQRHVKVGGRGTGRAPYLEHEQSPDGCHLGRNPLKFPTETFLHNASVSYRMTQKNGNSEEIQTCKTFLWRQHAVHRSTDPWLPNGEVVCSSRFLFRSAANCTWLPLRISKVPVFFGHSVHVMAVFKSPHNRNLHAFPTQNHPHRITKTETQKRRQRPVGEHTPTHD